MCTEDVQAPSVSGYCTPDPGNSLDKKIVVSPILISACMMELLPGMRALDISKAPNAFL
jgi:hypothetical protein